MEYSKLSSEIEEYSVREQRVIQEKEALLKKLEAQKRTIDMLTSSEGT